MADRWVEPEFLFVTCIPPKFDVLVAVVDDLEGDCLGLANDAIADSELILQVVRQAFESDTFVEAFADKHDLVLLVDVIHG